MLSSLIRASKSESRNERGEGIPHESLGHQHGSQRYQHAIVTDKHSQITILGDFPFTGILDQIVNGAVDMLERLDLRYC